MAGQPEGFNEIVQRERDAQLQWEQEQARLAAAPPPAPVPVQLSPEEQHINQLNGVLWSDGILVARAALRAKVHQDWVKQKPLLGGWVGDRKARVGWYISTWAWGERNIEDSITEYYGGLALDHLGRLYEGRKKRSYSRVPFDANYAKSIGDNRNGIVRILNEATYVHSEVRVKTDEELAKYRRDLARFVIRHSLDLGDHRIY